MQNKRLFSLLSAATSFILLMLSSTLPVNAASINYFSNGNRIASGINDLEVNGQNYKVMFAKTTPAPEPMTIMGTLTAVSMGVVMKKKQKNKSAA